MRWITFFILLYLATALQWARFGALSPAPNPSPLIEYLPMLAIFYALYATDNGNAFASALTRLANQNLAEADPDPLVEFFLYSHLAHAGVVFLP